MDDKTKAQELVRMAHEWRNAYSHTNDEKDAYLEGMWDVLELLERWEFAADTYWQIHYTVYPERRPSKGE